VIFGQSHPASFPSRLLQGVGILVFRALVCFLYRCEVRRCGPLPPAPVLFAANHRSFLDPMLVGMWVHDPISYFAKAELWRLPIVGFTLRLMRSIPVERDNPGMSSMKGAIERLRQRISVLIFPEGTRTRSGRVGRLRDGPALFARRAGVPIVPVYVHRTEKAWPRGRPLPTLGNARIAICFGRPLVPPPGLPPRELDRWMTNHLHAWFVAVERRMYARRSQGDEKVSEACEDPGAAICKARKAKRSHR